MDNLHAGPYANQGYFQYKWYGGKPKSSCLIFAIATEAQKPGEGGLVLMPGSHKSLLGMTAPEVFTSILELGFSDSDMVVIPALQPGDSLVMTEALMHDSAQWKVATRRRRNLYFKYCLGSMGWLPQDNPGIERLRHMARNEQERLLFRPSYVSTRDGIEGAIGWRRPTYPRMARAKTNRIESLVRKLPERQKQHILNLVHRLPPSSRRRLLRMMGKGY